MKNPSMADIFSDIYGKIDNIDTEDTEFGDEENTNVTIPVIDTISAVVTYYPAPITRTPLARIEWSWSEPLMYDEDGNVIDPSDPDIADDIFLDTVADYRFGVSTDGGAPASFRSTAGAREAMTEGHVLGLDVTITVFAVTKSGIKGPTSTFTATVTKDTTPPNKPNAPVVSNYMGAVIVRNNGLDSLGAAMSEDTAYVEIYMSVDGLSYIVAGRIYGVGTQTFSNLAYDVLHYFYFVAYDYSNNVSTASDVVNATPRKLVELDFDPGSVTETVIADDSISTPKLQALAVSTPKLAAQSVTADKLEATLVLTTEVLTGPVTEGHTRLSPEGLQIFGETATGAVYTLLEFVNGQANVIALSNDVGAVLASISGDGSANFQEVSVSDLQIAGLTMTDILAPYSKGLKSWFLITSNSASVSTLNVETQWFVVSFIAEKNRLYEITCHHGIDTDTANTITGARVRWEYDGVTPTDTSADIGTLGKAQPNTTAQGTDMHYYGVLSTAGQTAETRQIMLGYRLSRIGGASGAVWGDGGTSDGIFTVKDIGSSDISASANYVSVWNSTEVLRNGSFDITDGNALDLSTYWAQVLFTDPAAEGETAVTIDDALDGATVSKVEVRMSLYPLPNNSIITATVRSNTLMAASTSTPTGTGEQIGKGTSSKWRAWVDITDLGLFTATDRGLWLGDNGSAPYSAALLSVVDVEPVQIRITYTR